MASPREAAKPVFLDPRTFGDSPAAIYLVELLNKKNDPVLARKAAKVLAEGRRTIADLTHAHLDYDALSTRTFAVLLGLVSEHNKTKAAESLRATDGHVANLVINILEGGVKTWKRRVQEARLAEKKAARQLPPGTSAQWVPAVPLADEMDSETLRRRSKRHLARKGKLDTLY